MLEENEKSSAEPRKLIGHEFADFDETEYRERVFAVVRQIPIGRVMTYGQIARILGDDYTARTVGFVMHSANPENVPWHRVINAQGGCSTAKFSVPPDLQQKLLERENVWFNDRALCKLSEYLWTPDDAQTAKLMTPENSPSTL